MLKRLALFLLTVSPLAALFAAFLGLWDATSAADLAPPTDKAAILAGAVNSALDGMLAAVAYVLIAHAVLLALYVGACLQNQRLSSERRMAWLAALVLLGPPAMIAYCFVHVGVPDPDSADGDALPAAAVA